VPALVRGGPTSELDGLARESTRDRHHEELSNSRALLAALELHDPYTARHSRNTVRLATAVAERMRLSEPERFEVKLVAMLHDVGKIGLPDRIRNKPAALTPSERVVVNQHSRAGAEVVAGIEELAHLAPAIRACHERWDGTGYPDGLVGQEIPMPSRITFACDAYDAMTSDRPYRGAMPAATARAELRHGAGSQFCSRCVDALLEVLSDDGR
jgi:HD-GYP domain-containing protein (c-di-GMP phosphodiesterase class II)